MKISILAVAAGLLLSGCQVQQPCTSKSVNKASIDASHLHTTQQQLWHNGALNQQSYRIPGTFTANSDRLSIDWEGDAIELLAQLARQRGLNFGYTGVRLPLPVNVHVSNITFESLLRQLETQIGWRATLKQQPLELHLYFALPDKGDRLA
ncbi:defect-in-organelle-trafficking protein DotD [Serratia fonticola]|uniref:Defect-in-organelle-trafficking protein DotD n=1 Tax=Serratia fonticola TaxID=47917 RepID=A0A542CRY7_SERFO|nr:DotD/TraH family lipoprotein [Serratia fonticola]TQI77283.1 defect-in-organelle-trafficking protein DotD [Serratia fonticola]TQI93591.1 defect-in-organelle-trafficking protein DotD [Serratia fonticola]TVZ61620.1 defect-in-organelle-trafficking protein DotD [Serratia fonticola]